MSVSVSSIVPVAPSHLPLPIARSMTRIVKKALFVLIFLLLDPTSVLGGRGGSLNDGRSAVNRLIGTMRQKGGYSVSLKYLGKYGEANGWKGT